MIVLNERCRCGGRVLVITHPERDPRTLWLIDVVSHGICERCQRQQVLAHEWVERLFTERRAHVERG